MWKPEYEENRRRKAEPDPEYRERLRKNAIKNGRTPEENREYMRAYYAANKHKWNKRTPEWRAEWNAKRRALYAENKEYREGIKSKVREYNQRNPDAKRKHVLAGYGISQSEFDDMLKQQNGGCAICGRSESGDSRGFRFHIDHCHSTGKVRGILCSGCNLGIGKFSDDPERLELAAMYLRSHIRTPDPGD